MDDVRGQVRAFLGRRMRRRLIGPEIVEAIQNIASVRVPDAGVPGPGGDDGQGSGGDGGGGDPGPGGEGGGGGGGPGGPSPIDPVVIPGIAAMLLHGIRAVNRARVIGAVPVVLGWSDDFDDGVADLANYAFVGTWTEAAGVVGPTVAGAGVALNANSSMVYKRQAYTNVTVQAVLKNGINSGWSLLLCVDDPADPRNFYAAKFRTTAITFSKIVSGVAVQLATVTTDPAANDVCSVERNAGTGAWSVKLNGVEVLAGTDATFASGYVGLAVGSTNTTVTFDDFEVTPA